MQQAFGGILNIVFVAVFLIIVSGVLAFTVSYSKAFKMKNVVLSALEEYETAGCAKKGSNCYNRIKNGAKQYGYYPSNLRCPSGYYSFYGEGEKYFCVTTVNGTGNKSVSNGKVFRVITQVDVDIPIIKEIFSFSFFQVTGDTRVIQVQSGSNFPKS